MRDVCRKCVAKYLIGQLRVWYWYLNEELRWLIEPHCDSIIATKATQWVRCIEWKLFPTNEVHRISVSQTALNRKYWTFIYKNNHWWNHEWPSKWSLLVYTIHCLLIHQQHVRFAVVSRPNARFQMNVYSFGLSSNIRPKFVWTNPSKLLICWLRPPFAKIDLSSWIHLLDFFSQYTA